jgi:hypothetical protein
MTDDPFDYKYPIPFPGCYQAGEGPQIDYDFYQKVDCIKVSELMGMLLDPYCEQDKCIWGENIKNEYIQIEKPEEWEYLYDNLWELISRGLMSGKLKALNYSPEKNTSQKVNFWTILLDPTCIKGWLDKSGIIKLIENTGIGVSNDFVELIKVLEHKVSSEKLILKLRTHFKYELSLKWDEISITLISADTIEIKIGDTKKKFQYSELGFSDKRKGDHPIIAWVILLSFIKGQGAIQGNSANSIPKLEVKMKGFKSHMKDLFGINEPLVPHYKSGKGYKVMFKTYDKTHTDFQDLLEKLNFTFK